MEFYTVNGLDYYLRSEVYDDGCCEFVVEIYNGPDLVACDYFDRTNTLGISGWEYFDIFELTAEALGNIKNGKRLT